MTDELTSLASEFEPLIVNDLAKGGFQTFDRTLKLLRQRSGADTDVLELARSNMVQVDVCVDTGNTHRLSFHTFPSGSGNGQIRDLSVWRVNEKGYPSSDMHTLFNYPGTGKGGQQTVVEGSSNGSLDGGDLIITPSEFANSLAQALVGLNTYNWRLVVGNANVPEGEI